MRPVLVYLCAYFYPRPPRGGRPLCDLTVARAQYFYPRPPRGGRRLPEKNRQAVRSISIHALREEGDPLDFAVVSWL